MLDGVTHYRLLPPAMEKSPRVELGGFLSVFFRSFFFFRDRLNKSLLESSEVPSSRGLSDGKAKSHTVVKQFLMSQRVELQ